MADQPNPPVPPTSPTQGKQDDGAFWSIVAYLISGLLFWGGAGAVADHFLNTHLFLLIGLLVGMAAGLGLIWMRFIRQ